MYLDITLREEIGMGGSSKFYVFLGVGGKGGDLKKKSYSEKLPFYSTINPESMKFFRIEIFFLIVPYISERCSTS